MQMQLPNSPGACPHELQVVDMSENNLKSECDLTTPDVGHPTWTNCRTWGRCTLGGDEWCFAQIQEAQA